MALAVGGCAMAMVDAVVAPAVASVVLSLAEVVAAEMSSEAVD